MNAAPPVKSACPASDTGGHCLHNEGGTWTCCRCAPTLLQIVRQLRTQDRCTACGYLTSAPGHRLICGEPPAVRLWKPVSDRALTALQIVRQLQPQPAARSALSVCEPCWEDMCEACQGGRCLCACQDERRPA